VYHLDVSSQIPLHIQLYEEIKTDIVTHRRVGDKLPSIRALAHELNVSKTTVESAYSQLYAEGYIESRERSGYYVGEYRFEIEAEQVPQVQARPRKRYRYDFFPAQLDGRDFPLKLWKRLTNKALADEGMDWGGYPDGQGEWGLRDAIAQYLGQSRGVMCRADEVVITHGFADSMGLLAKLVRNRYDRFGMEEPGYHLAWKVFAEYGYAIEKIAVGEQGIDPDALRASRAQVVYITPSHQYPTGATLPVARRQQILDHIASVDGLIIEDDYDSELAYATRPIPALQGLDRNDRVVYLGTFAKSLSPAIRVGYMVLPRHLMPQFAASYDAHFARVSLLTQKTLELFIGSGHYARHLRRIRTLNRKKHDRMKALFAEHLGKTYTILAQGGGLAILIMPTVPFDWKRFFARAEEERIKLYMARERSGGTFEAIRMGFGGFGLDELEEAVVAFGRVWREAVR
jgi:GntR family transcriptional regulator/MocR family aminotransferase